MPDPAFATSLGGAGAALALVQRRSRLRSMAFAVAAGGALFALALIVTVLLLEADREASLWMAAVAGAVAAIWIAARAPLQTKVDAARAVERTTAGLDNLIVTAAELDERPRPVRAEIRDAIMRQADERAHAIDPRATVPLLQPITVAAVVLAGCALLSGLGSVVLPGVIPGVALEVIANAASGGFEVRVIPPVYTGRTPESLRDPAQISVIAGSRIQIPIAKRDWVATESAAIQFTTSPGAPSRFLSVIVVPDLPPSIRVVDPGKDTAFAEPAGQVAISIQTGDDLGLAALSLRFTKASGGGENVSFSEGELPLRIERRSGREWVGRTDVSLDGLGLEDGDILVYRAIARDTNPAGAAVQSDQYLIEIGRHAEIADAGFALPSEEKKYAISQQMVIYKTEQLLQGAGRRVQGATFTGDLLDQSRMLGMEQRMVRAEVVFLSGGEVEDEVEEAAHSHELAEGRMQNTGRVEMMRALNSMSRAEALLNDGRAKEALVFEREALAHLERALDRRRYFLRTLPDRSRIDATRRLTGERRDARPWNRDRQASPAAGSMAAQRQVMRDLAAGPLDANLAARLAAIDPSSVPLQNAAVALASAATDTARAAAARSAMAALTNHALQSLPGSSPAGMRLDPLAGRLADEMTNRPRQ